jgi:hypothetical protein
MILCDFLLVDICICLILLSATKQDIVPKHWDGAPTPTTTLLL